MAGETPLYFVTKPPPAQQAELERCRAAHGIDGSYGRERFHCTLVRLGDSRGMTSGVIGTIIRAAQSLIAEPFPITLDEIDGNLLKVRKGVRAAAAFQRALVQRLRASGVVLPPHTFWLHLSLAYRGTSNGRAKIHPIGWLAEDFLLIRSIHGEGRHEEVGRWPLTPRQLGLDF